MANSKTNGKGKVSKKSARRGRPPGPMFKVQFDIRNYEVPEEVMAHTEKRFETMTEQKLIGRIKRMTDLTKLVATVRVARIAGQYALAIIARRKIDEILG